MSNESSEEDDGYLGIDSDADVPRNVEEFSEEVVKRDPIELKDQIDTLDKPLIIEVACSGFQLKQWPPLDVYDGRVPPGYEEGGTRYPAIPCSVEEQADEIIEAVQAGCPVSHVHPRHPEDCLPIVDVDLLAEIYDRIFEAVDVVPLQRAFGRHPEGGIDYVEPAQERLEAGDGTNRYVEAAPMGWPMENQYYDNYREQAQKGIQFYEENDIKPLHRVCSMYDVKRMYQDLIEPGVMTEKPYVISYSTGRINGWPMDRDPWKELDLISAIQQTKELIPDSLIGVSAGGRNWMPTTMSAILMGVDMVRVGIEDFYWMYPHKDEVIENNMECVNKILEFCDLIGREVASPDQAREIMGITKTDPTR